MSEFNHAELLDRTKKGGDLEDVATVATAITDYLKDDFALIVGTTGGPGIGKSTLDQWLAYLINPYAFDVAKNTAMKPTTEAFIEQFEALPKYSAIIGDEGAWYAFNRTFMSGFQIYLMQYLKTFRKHHNKAVLLCMTSINKFDKDLRSGDTMYFWLHVISRGHAIFFESSKNFFSSDGFKIKENEKLLDAYFRTRRGQVDSDDITNFLRSKSTNFVAEIKFPDLPRFWKKTYLEETEKTRAWYAEYRRQQQHELAVRAERRYDSLCESIRWLYDGDERAPQRTLAEIAARLKHSESTILKWKQDAEKAAEKGQAKT